MKVRLYSVDCYCESSRDWFDTWSFCSFLGASSSSVGLSQSESEAPDSGRGSVSHDSDASEKEAKPPTIKSEPDPTE